MAPGWWGRWWWRPPPRRGGCSALGGGLSSATSASDPSQVLSFFPTALSCAPAMGGAGRTRDGAIHRQGPRTARESRHSAQTSIPTTMRTYCTVRRIECCTRDGHAGGTPLPARTCGAREQRVPPRSQREPASTPGGLIRGAPRGPPGPFRRSGPLPNASRPHWPAGACMQIGRLPASMARSGPPSPKGSCAAALHQRYALTDDSTGVPIPVGIRGGDIVARARNRIATPSQRRSLADPPWRHIQGWSQIRSQTGVERFAKTCCELQRCAFRARRSTKVSCVLLLWVLIGCPKLSHSIEALKSRLEELERSLPLTEEYCQPASRGSALSGHSQVGYAARDASV